jgi:hypothetical protein
VTTSIAHLAAAKTKGTDQRHEGLLVVYYTVLTTQTECDNGVIRFREHKPHSIKEPGKPKIVTSKVCLPQSLKILV